MSVEAQVRAAKNPQEAMLVIARGLDVIIQNMQEPRTETNPWGSWEAEPSPEPNPELAKAVQTYNEHRVGITHQGDDTSEVVIPLPSAEKQAARVKFEAQYIKLNELLGHNEDWSEAYAKGGPMWLYLANRDLVMGLPYQIKQAMIEDVAEESPQDAHEMGRDLLKHPGESGPGSPAMMIGEGQIG